MMNEEIYPAVVGLSIDPNAPATLLTAFASQAHDSSLEDRSLVERVLKGDEEAYDSFVWQLGSMTNSVFTKFEHPDELLQALCVHLWINDWNQLRKWNGSGSLRSFIRTVAQHLAIDAYRKQCKLREHEVVFVDAEPTDVEDLVDFGEAPGETLSAQEAIQQFKHLQSRLHQALGSLSAPDREVLLLSYFQQLDGREAASHLKITHAAYRQRIRRAINRLREVVLRDYRDLQDLFNSLFD